MPDSIIDVQVKRFHEYKRQQMLLLYLIWKYFDIKSGTPKSNLLLSFLVGAAPAYVAAQDIIHVILFSVFDCRRCRCFTISSVVIMIENYNVTAAEPIFQQQSISEQTSLASKASGTQHEVHAIGVVAACTVDGNVEIRADLQCENIYAFGASWWGW